ncbi:histone deacetylase family protein [Pseudothermotoga sp.]|nr:histone deacetylase family protein [Pseudothermotoga sp.]MCX7812788.1 histone deacetylase family protein [Pseudothermotoga sp.]MDW8139068.1 histone deacetylase family protein [Pseudothermotoga sp.]
MKIVYDPKHVLHRPSKEIDKGRFIENPEKPDRIESIKDALIMNGFDNIHSPNTFPMSYIYLVHEERYVKWLKNKCASLQPNEEYIAELFGYDLCFDTGTPISSTTFESAKRAVDVTLTAATLLTGRTNLVYALVRPPGHHATRSACGGYCYFNNAAVAAVYFLKDGADGIAILDLDFHHGNGTQDIFYSTDRVLYVSIHGDPDIFYPWISGRESETGEGPGEGFNINLPLPAKSDWSKYSEALDQALREVKDYYPDVLIVSLGFDTHKDDPVGGFSLNDDDFARIGKAIGKLKIPTLVVQEGGYNPQANISAAVKFFSAIA